MHGRVTSRQIIKYLHVSHEPWGGGLPKLSSLIFLLWKYMMLQNYVFFKSLFYLTSLAVVELQGHLLNINGIMKRCFDDSEKQGK